MVHFFFTETAEFMIVIQERDISNNNYNKYILKNQKFFKDICRKFGEKSETLR